jgi:hypothetical protein
MRPLASTLLALMVLAVSASAQAPAPLAAPPKPVEVPVPPEVLAEAHRTLADAIRRFEAMDEDGVLAYVSERYHSGGLTKAVVRQQLRAIFSTNESVRARVQIREVRMIDGRLWVSSSGDVTGRLRFFGTPVSILGWTDAWDVAWRENGRWLLIGDRG